jgi:hypothetical protein
MESQTMIENRYFPFEFLRYDCVLQRSTPNTQLESPLGITLPTIFKVVPVDMSPHDCTSMIQG